MLRYLTTVPILLFVACSASWAKVGVELRIGPSRASISNAYLSLEFSLADGRARTALIKNLRAGKAMPAEGEKFSLEFASGHIAKASDFRLESAKAEPAGSSGKRLVLELHLDDLRVRMVTEMHAGEWWATRWLEIEGAKERLVGVSLARWRCVAAIGPAGSGKQIDTLGFPSGCGQAVYAQDLFFALAHPGAENFAADGFWPDCRQHDHGHPIGPAGAIAQMDSLMDVFAMWRRAKPDLRIGYTFGSNPSPFWLQHADFIWRGGADDSHAGVGEPFDRHNTFIDTCLQAHRTSDAPMSAFVTFDIVQNRIAGNRDDVFEKGIWWLAARTSLHHDWYIQASDLTTDRWRILAKAANWAKSREKIFQYSRMVGGDPAGGEIYGFSAFDDGSGTLALRNPSAEPRRLQSTLAALLALPEAERSRSFRLRGVFGETRALEGVRKVGVPLTVELPPLAIAVLEVERIRF